MSSLLREAEAELKETNERIHYTGQYYASRQGMDRGHVPHSRIIVFSDIFWTFLLTITLSEK